MKSAYERALEKLSSQGIEAPRRAALSEDQRRRIEDARARHRAKLAELEILHRKNLSPDPATRHEEEENYQVERRRLSDRLDAEIDRIRDGR